MAKKILFVEDEIDQINMIKMRLEANGYEFFFAIDGEEGLKEVHKVKPDLILLDILLAKIDGIEMCRRLKKDPDTQNIPIIGITASGMKDIEDQCRNVGMALVIKKPYDSKDLLDKIAVVMK